MIYSISVKENDTFYVTGRGEEFLVPGEFLREHMKPWKYEWLLKDGSQTVRDTWDLEKYKIVKKENDNKKPIVDDEPDEALSHSKKKRWFYRREQFMVEESWANPGVYEVYVKDEKHGFYRMIVHAFALESVPTLIREYLAWCDYEKKIRRDAYLDIKIPKNVQYEDIYFHDDRSGTSAYIDEKKEITSEEDSKDDEE